jgi:hypothetical protein
MEQKYEYKFVRLGEGFMGVKRNAIREYQDIITAHANEGWRLVQVFSPSIGVYGASTFYEIIFEKPCV